MTRFFLILTTTLAALNVAAQTQQWHDPATVAVGKEPARSLVKSYNTADGALMQGRESLYLQPLTGEWTVSEAGNETIHERDFKVPFAWVDRHVLLHLDAVGAAFEVFVNDQKVGYSQSTGTPSEFDIARYTLEGRNSLKIVVHRDHVGHKIENYASQSSGELGRDNYVLAQPRVRVRDFVADTRIEDGNGLFSLGVIVKSQLLNNKELKVYYDLLSPEGRSVASAHRDAQFDMRGEDTVRFFANIPNVKTWSHEAPNLYTLAVKTQHEGRFTEYLSFKVGFRTVEMVEGEMLINGSPITLIIAQYQSKDSAEIMRSELTQLKGKGVNAIKVEDRPQSGAFYDLCDELGLYVCDQAAVDTHLSGASRRKSGNLSNDPRWECSFTDRAMRMYHNSKNHPSVVMFSIAENSANGYNLYQSYLALKALERSRPVIYLSAAGEWNSDAVLVESAANKQNNKVVFNPDNVKSAETFAPITLSEVDAKSGVFRVTNNYKLKSLDEIEVRYEVRVGKRLSSEGKLIVSVGAQESTDIAVPYIKIKPGSKVSVKLIVDEPVRAYCYVPEKIVVEEQEKTSPLSIFSNIGLKSKMEFKPVRMLMEADFTTVL